MTDQLDLDEGERLLAAATPRPWRLQNRGDSYVGERYWVADVGLVVPNRAFILSDGLDGGRPVTAHLADAALICWAVNHLPALLARARRVDELERQCEALADRWIGWGGNARYCGEQLRAALAGTEETHDG